MNEQRKAIIQVKNLTTHYGATRILHNVTFDVYEGEIFVVLGPSGCGKSTLMKHMLGLHPATSGSIVIDGVNLEEASEKDLTATRRKIGALFQGGALFSSMTLEENVGLPLREHTNLNDSVIRSLASMKLEMVNLGGKEHAMPAALSGGMKKRAGLARAMALDPKILFFDEPSAGLDPITSAGLDELILKINSAMGTTIVMVTHELSSILRVGKRAMLLDHGEMVAIGTLDDLRTNPAPLAQRFFERLPEPGDEAPGDSVVDILTRPRASRG